MIVPQFKVFMAEDADEKVATVLKSGYIGQGPKVEEFEAALGAYLGNTDVVAVNSCTSALHLALHMTKQAGIDHVITTPLTCFATTAAIIQAGLKPIWCDVDPVTCNIDLRHLQELLETCTHRISAILIVHYGGYPVDISLLDRLLMKYRHEKGCQSVVIEDCAHALGAQIDHLGMVGAGQYGNYCCHSFQAIKTLTTGDGGAIVGGHHFNRSRHLRWFGMDRNRDRYTQDIVEAGFKYQMNDIAASIGLSNIVHLGKLVSKQQLNISWYQATMPDLVTYPRTDFQSSGWMCPIQVGDAKEFDRAMQDRGVSTGLTHRRNDIYTCVEDFKGPELPGVTKAEESVSCIPSGWWVGLAERQYIFDCIQKGW